MAVGRSREEDDAGMCAGEPIPMRPGLIPAIVDRRSIRDFLPRRVEREKIDLMLEAARLAPSSINLQPFRAIVAEQPRDVLALRRSSYGVGPCLSAPVVIVCLADTKATRELTTRLEELGRLGIAELPDLDFVRSGTGRPYHLKLGEEMATIDSAIAAEHMVLQAVECGLGTCWVHNFEVDEVRAHFRIPAHLKIIGLIAVGYADDATPRWPRIGSVEYMPPRALPRGADEASA